MESKLPQNKEKPITPNWEESEFAKSIDGQVLLMVKGAITNGSFIEAQTLSWATIEQLLLPRLIGWIAKIHKLDLPDEVYKLNAQSINLLYLTFSHDIELFQKLEEARRKRNEIIHKLTTLGDVSSMKRVAKESTEINILLQEEIMKRFSGEVQISSINLYRNGWNDALNNVAKELKLYE
jgi:hypothetical protein